MNAVAEAVGAALGSRVVAAERVSGGSINEASRLRLGSGDSVLVKTRPRASTAEFAAEAAGLRWIADGGAAVPRVLGHVDGAPWLALEWIEPGTLSANGADELGRGLAALHRSGASAHGSLPPGSPDGTLRLGSVELAMAEGAAWPALYAERMLRPLVRRALDLDRLSEADAKAVESACERIDDLAGPDEPPSRLHGDLWGGNVLADEDGRGVLIDPAAYGGHREVDLAMLRLFGAPSERIFAAYGEAHPLAAGHAERVGLWQLLPLLIHAVLFGGSYGASAGEAARRYR